MDALANSFRITGLLVWNDCKQGLRKHMSGVTLRDKLLRAGGVTFGLAFIAALHLGAFAMVTYAAGSPSPDRAALMAGLSTSVWSFLLFVMLSGGLVRALVVLHEQDDSSLLLASPASPRAVLAGRLFGNALQSCLVDGFIIIPYINVRFFTGPAFQFHFLWGYVVWFALAIIVTCIDGLFSFGLIRAFGMRRARTLSQAVPFLLIFAVTFFAGSISLSVAQIDPDNLHMPLSMQQHFIMLAHTPLAWMAYAAAGNPGPLLSIIAFALALSWITLLLTERAFIEGTQNIAENESSAKPGSADGPFRGGIFALEIRKNWCLILRTPMMMVQCLAQALMPVGIAFVMGAENPSRAVAFFVIFACGVLSGMFTIAAGSVEQCEDLLLMSPHDPRRFRFGKIATGLLYPAGTALFVGLGLAVLGQGTLALAVILGGIPLATAASICGETFATPAKPGTRPKLLADPIMMIPLLGINIISGIVAGGTVYAAWLSNILIVESLIASYVLLLIAIGLAQLRKPLLA